LTVKRNDPKHSCCPSVLSTSREIFRLEV